MCYSVIVTHLVMTTNNMTSSFLGLSNVIILSDMVLHQRHSNLYYLLIPIPWLNLAVQILFTYIIVGYLKSKPPLSQTGVLSIDWTYNLYNSIRIGVGRKY